MHHNFKNLLVWQRACALAESLYILVKKLPDIERYGLRSQIQRAAISVPSNIAEGCGRESNKELHHYLNIAIGSLCELETQLILTKRLRLFKAEATEPHLKEINEIRKMISALRKQL
ncbi:MAG: four helix bundle protein [Calditrichota bacterium]